MLVLRPPRTCQRRSPRACPPTLFTDRTGPDAWGIVLGSPSFKQFFIRKGSRIANIAVLSPGAARVNPRTGAGRVFSRGVCGGRTVTFCEEIPCFKKSSFQGRVCFRQRGFQKSLECGDRKHVRPPGGGRSCLASSTCSEAGGRGLRKCPLCACALARPLPGPSGRVGLCSGFPAESEAVSSEQRRLLAPLPWGGEFV